MYQTRPGHSVGLGIGSHAAGTSRRGPRGPRRSCSQSYLIGLVFAGPAIPSPHGGGYRQDHQACLIPNVPAIWSAGSCGSWRGSRSKVGHRVPPEIYPRPDCHLSWTSRELFRIDNLPHLAPCFFDYLTNPRIVGLAEEIVGGRVRLEQSDVHIRRPDNSAGGSTYGFHRGLHGNQSSQVLCSSAACRSRGERRILESPCQPGRSVKLLLLAYVPRKALSQKRWD